MSILTFQYRIKDSTSAKHLSRMASAVNFTWNFANEASMLALRRNHEWLTAYDLIKLTSGTSKDLGIHTDTQSEVCREYAIKRRQFKKRRLAWRSKKRSLGWVPFKGRCVRVQDDTVTYCGHTFRFWLSRPIEGTIKTGSFTQDARSRWYVNFQCEVDDPGIPLGQADIGIDLGLTNNVACSDGTTYRRENLTRKHEKALGMVHRARKKRRVKTIHAKIANIRKDWAHKTTTKIVNRAKVVVVGNVSSTKLAATRMAKSVYDAGWYQLRSMFAYKAKRLGVQYGEVNEAYSSVTCSACSERTGPSGIAMLGIREWSCVSCGTVHNRDTNAARNILATFRMGRHTLAEGIP